LISFSPKIYLFDGSFNGLLCAVFASYERKDKEVRLIKTADFAAHIFEEPVEIATDGSRAARVWNGLKAKIAKAHLQQFFNSYFAEQPQVYQDMFDYCHYIFDNEKGVDFNYGNPLVLSLAQTANKVQREKHRMEAFIRFQKGGNGLFFAVAAPDFNVLPLVVKHFKNRYADQPWVIYDTKRKYGIHYDLNIVSEIKMNLVPAEHSVPEECIAIDEKEELYAQLWKDYFKSTNIVERKNLKLHLQHVPKRYWKYLTEKQ
jgi:probable DNA metabolism protein